MKKHRYHVSMPIVLAAAVASAIPGVATAQLEEVLVTAERREASVQDVPIAVSAYSEEMIERLQIDDTLDLINVVPNLFGGNNTGLGTANMYYLRAQGNDESISTFDPPVGTYVDDVYITRQNVNNVALFDVAAMQPTMDVECYTCVYVKLRATLWGCPQCCRHCCEPTNETSSVTLYVA